MLGCAEQQDGEEARAPPSDSIDGGPLFHALGGFPAFPGLRPYFQTWFDGAQQRL